MDMNDDMADCEELFSKIKDEIDIDNNMKKEILQEFEKKFKYDNGYYYKLMNWMNVLNTCGVFLKIYKDPTVSKYIDDKIKLVSEKMQNEFINKDCNSDGTANINNLKTTETTEYINDMGRKLINYYKFLCVNQYLEKFKLPTNGELIGLSNNMSENVYYLELPKNIQEMSELTISDYTYEIWDSVNKKYTEYYISRGFLCLGRLKNSTSESNFLNNNIIQCLSREGYEITNDDIKNNLWKVKSPPSPPSQSNGGKRKTKRNKKIHRKRKTMKRVKVRRTRHRKRVNTRHSKKYT